MNSSFTDVVDAAAQAAIEGRLLLFVGTGFSRAVLNWRNKGGKPIPDWLGLLGFLCGKFRLDTQDFFCRSAKEMIYDCPAIASAMANRIESAKLAVDPAVLKIEAAAATCWIPTKEQCRSIGKLLRGLNLSAIVTTNYDEIVEALLGKDGQSMERRDDVRVPLRERIAIWHVHGSVNNPADIVLTREDYLEFFRPGNYQQSKLAHLLHDYVTIFAGYSLSDLNLLSALDWAANVYPSKSGGIQHYQIGDGKSACFLVGGKENGAMRQIVLAYDSGFPIPECVDDLRRPTCRIVKTNDILKVLSSIQSAIDQKTERVFAGKKFVPDVVRPASGECCMDKERVARIGHGDEWERTRGLDKLASDFETANQFGFLTEEAVPILETLRQICVEQKKRASRESLRKWKTRDFAPYLSLRKFLFVLAKFPVEKLPASCRVVLFDELERRAIMGGRSPSAPPGEGEAAGFPNIPAKRICWIREVASYLGNDATIRLMDRLVQKDA